MNNNLLLLHDEVRNNDDIDGTTTTMNSSQMMMQQQHHHQHHLQQRYDLRPRPKNRSDVIQIPINPAFLRPNAKPPSPTSVLRHFGLITYSTYELGTGHYSKVYKAYQGDREVAVKIIKMDQVGEEFIKRFIPREKECWAKIRHRNICELFACLGCEQFNYLFMVMEYCQNGDLLSYVQRNGPLSDELGRRWMRALLDAIVYLHKNNIAHRDIKAENVLISRRNNVKLTDFGFVCELSDNFYSRTYCGSRAYSSPEVLKGIPYDVYKNDVWSLGVLCYVSMTNTMPFREDSNANSVIIEQQRRKSYRWPYFVAADCQQSVDTMMSFYQDERPSAKQLKKLPFFVRTSSQTKIPFDESNPVELYA